METHRQYDWSLKETQKKLRNAEMGLEILKKVITLFSKINIMYAFIDSNREHYPVGMMER